MTTICCFRAVSSALNWVVEIAQITSAMVEVARLTGSRRL
jgi:hypothetical protein